MTNTIQKYYVYAISSLERNYIYVGMTNNLDRRIGDHNKGYNRTTKTSSFLIVVLVETLLQQDFHFQINFQLKNHF